MALSPVRACRASDGATVWSVPSPLTTNLTAGPDAVYAVAVALYALNSRHGTRLWSCAANAMTAPLLAGGVIYVPGCDTYSNTSLMLAIRASDGRQTVGGLARPGRWMAGLRRDDRLRRVRRQPRRPASARRRPGADPDVDLARQRRPAAVPVTSQRRLLLTAGHDRGHGLRADGRERAHPPGLHAVNPGTGRTAWSYPGASAAPAAARGRVCTASPAGDLIALNASDGAPAWQCPIRVTLGTRPRRPHRPCLRQHHGLRRPGLSQ